MKKRLFNSIFFAIIVILIFIISPNVIGIKTSINQYVITNGETFYVGGDGLYNYSTIQDAINHSDNGDIIYVFHGIYNEHIIVNKSIFLIGEEKNNTIIDGNDTDDIISILANNTTIVGFTIQNSGDTPMYDAGIEIHSDNNLITDNIIRYNGEFGVGLFLNKSSENVVSDNIIYNSGNEGIYLENSKNNLIYNNNLYLNGHCSIVLSNSRNNTIIKNNINNNYAGISLWPNSIDNNILNNKFINQVYSGIGIWANSNSNHIANNIFINNSLYGIIIYSANANTIEYNYIYGSSKGIAISFSFFNNIENNDFFNNTENVFINSSFKNYWHGNFWDDHTNLLPKIIPSEFYIHLKKDICIKWFDVDLSPSVNPNTITGFKHE